MRLTLRLLSHGSHAPDNPQEKTFESFPVFIGRAPSCDYVLDDISKYISSNHASIVVEGGQLMLQDTSSNGVYINGSTESLGRGNSIPLTDGDTLTVGDYSLSVAVATAASAPDPFAGFGGDSDDATQQTPAPADPFDPFRGEDHDWTPPSQQAPTVAVDDGFSALAPAAAFDPGSTNTDDDGWPDWDPPESSGRDANAAPRPAPPRPSASPPPSPPASPHQSNQQSPFDEIDARPAVRPARPAPSDEFDWLPGTADETVSTPNPGIPRATRSPSPPPAARRQPPQQPQRQPPQPPASRPPGHSPPQAAPPAGGDASVFFKAAGLAQRSTSPTNEQLMMRNAGLVLRRAVEGLMQLLQSRAVLKNAIRTDVTLLSRDNNNALKFSATPEDALQALLEDSTQRGFLPGDVAVQQATDDLKAHQLAMLDGMKAAVRAVLAQFNPDELEKRLEQSSSIAANIPITREAKLWQLFQERFGEIQEEALTDFTDAFGKEFRAAYEKRIKELGRMPDG